MCRPVNMTTGLPLPNGDFKSYTLAQAEIRQAAAVLCRRILDVLTEERVDSVVSVKEMVVFKKALSRLIDRTSPPC